MTGTGSVLFALGTGLLTLFLGFFAASGEVVKPSKARPAKSKTVWIVMFSSSECPHCESAKELVGLLKNKYPVRTKIFDIGREPDQAVFNNFETIHAPEKFSVPLVLVGDSILMGENEISGRLEGIVRKLARSGGSRLPYLGPPKTEETSGAKASNSDTGYDERGRPPSIGEELRKVRNFLRKLF